MRKLTPRRLSVLLIAAVLIPLVSSCAAEPRQEPASSPPAVGEAAESPAATPPAPAPSPSPPPSEGMSPIPEAWRDNGIFLDDYERAYALLETMTAAEKTGQLLLAHYPAAGDAENFIKEYRPGGFVFFEPDFRGKSADDVVAMLQACQDASGIPLVMAVDEEGGSVVRLSRNPLLSDHRFLSPQRLFKNGGLEAIRADALEKAALFNKLGLNLNLAPVADVSVNQEDFIYPRTFGQPAAETAGYVAAIVSAMQKTGVSSSLKHFPGYGSNQDTHQGAAVDTRPYIVFTSGDFIPFRAGIAAGAETVMISHTIVDCMEPGVPASLSPKVHEILREELGFTGIILTDDLGMGAVKKYAGDAGPYVPAVLAGNDMLIVSDAETAFHSILSAVNSGEIPSAVLDRAVFRILSWKLARGMIADTGV